MHNDERAINRNEDYFVAKIEKGAWKLDEGGVYSTVKYNKGDWILFGRWYELVPSKTSAARDSFYSKVQRLEQSITMKWVRPYYRLDGKLHDHIEKKGNISY